MYLHKAVIRGEVVSHRIPPALVVSFEEWEESADLLENLEINRSVSMSVLYFTVYTMLQASANLNTH